MTLDLRHTICPECDDYIKPHPSNIIEVFIELVHIMSKGFNSTLQILHNKMMNTNNMLTKKYQKIKYFFNEKIPNFLNLHHNPHHSRSSRTGYNDDNNNEHSYMKIKHQDSFITKFNIWKIFNKKYHHHHYHHQGFSIHGTIPWIDINNNHNNQHHNKMKRKNNNHNYYKNKLSYHFNKIIYLLTDYYGDAYDHSYDMMKNMISKVMNWLK